MTFFFLQLLLLPVYLFAPPFILLNWHPRLSWTTRYALAIAPVAITYLGWLFGSWAFNYFECGGNFKMMGACLHWGYDFSSVIEFFLFLMIPGMALALPMSILLLLGTLYQHASSLYAKKWGR
jgi:hypothetical protein